MARKSKTATVQPKLNSYSVRETDGTVVIIDASQLMSSDGMLTLYSKGGAVAQFAPSEWKHWRKL